MARSILGVGFLLFASGNGSNLPRLFTIKELESKPAIFKEKNMISFPLETFKEKDVTIQKTILRLMDEEIGIHPDQVELCNIFSRKFNLIPGRNDIFTAYGYGIFQGDLSQTFQPKDTDITYAGWKTIPELLRQRVRIEVKPILNHFTETNHYPELIRRIKAT
jgi:hypothetical protein